MIGLPWDQRLARWLVRPLAGVPAVHPNHITTASLFLALGAGLLFARGDRGAGLWGAALFALARFVDHADGELARLTGRSSRLGYYYDFAVGGLSSGALFLGIGVGLGSGGWTDWPVLLGMLAAVSGLAATAFGIAVEAAPGPRAPLYPSAGGFELEDGIYLIVPFTWLGWLGPFFVLSSIGQVIFCLAMLGRLRAARRA
ncbi:MAG: CDP-alcohol phosphatidyltransferase family protein [Candidatus Rokubacteria bacterium]|nr:CDP-alcohol phosphatidyltransferase family protein [Candidatus Rokubacteria bacterium]